MVRVPNQVVSAKAVDAIKLPKPKTMLVEILVNHQILNENRQLKESLPQVQVNLPMVLAVVNAVAVKAFPAIVQDQICAVIDKIIPLTHSLMSALCIKIPIKRNPINV
jgi:aspartokinase-like uncharacterized kinase